MANYSKVQSQIAQLQRQANAARRSEMAGVIKRIKEVIVKFGISREDLFSSGPSTKPEKARSTSAGATYSDGQGKSWGGRGPRPAWLRDAIAGGKSLLDFAMQSAPAKKKTGSHPAAKESRLGIRCRSSTETVRIPGLDVARSHAGSVRHL